MDIGDFLYDYLIVMPGNERPQILANYSSNAVPPQIGSVINLSELYSDREFFRFRVVDVEETPKNSDGDLENTCSVFDVKVTVIRA